MNAKYQQVIANIFRSCVNDTITRVLRNPPTYRPFHSALLPDEAIFYSSFERGFSTSFGQKVIEQVAYLVALANGADEAQRQKESWLQLDVAYDYAISQHIQALRAQNADTPHDLDTAIAAIRSIKLNGQTKDIRVISDLWWKKDGIDHFISLKTAKPNIDQTAVAKEDCLRLSLALPNCRVYFGLPYNPYGESKDSYAFHPPMRIFDFHHDPVVLIDKELWNTIGGYGCYDELIAIAKDVGQDTKRIIQAKLAQR